MAGGKPFFKGLIKREVTAEAQKILNNQEFNKEFTSDFISDLIQEKHYFCSLHSLRPSKFRKKRRAGGPAKYNLEGFFPENGWHGVSWVKCINPQSKRKWVTDALRLAVQPQMFMYKQSHVVCERCGTNNATEVDHVKPEFKEIIDQAFSLMSEDDWKRAFKNYDWWNEDKFRLPANSPALKATLEMHKNATLQAVCKPCHVEAARERKTSNG